MTEALFRPAEPVLRSWRAWAVLTGALVVATLLSLGRQTGVPAAATLWAEDGTEFLAAAWQTPFGGSLLEPVASYLHLYPRLVGELSTLLPLEWAAAWFALCAALGAAAVAATVYCAAAAYIRRPELRVALAVLVLLSPVAGTEAVNNVANMQWFLTVAAFWCLLWRPERWGAVAWQTGLSLVAALSAPLLAVLVPLAVVRAGLVRTARGILPSAALLFGVAVQLAYLRDRPDESSMEVVPFLTGYAQRVAMGSLVGQRPAAELWRDVGWVGPVVAVLLLTALLGWAAVRPGSRHRWPIVIAVGASAAMFAASFAGRGSWYWAAWAPGMPSPIAGRYLIAPMALLHAALYLALDEVLEHRGREATSPRLRLGVLALVAVQLALMGASYPASNERSGGPAWQSSLEDAAEACEAEPVDTVDVEISPPPEWTAAVPCEEVPR